MRKLIMNALLGLGLCGSAMATEVVVDVYDGGQPESYTNGVGGTFSGVGGLTTAVGTINADPTAGVTTFTIRVHDTDGVQDLFVGDLPIGRNNVTIRQVANGSGNDVGAEIQGAANASPNAAILVQGDNFRLIGLSAQKPFKLRAASSNQGYVTGTNRDQAITVQWENLEYLPTASAPGDHNDFNVNGRGVNQTFRNVRFQAQNGPRFEAAGTVIENARFDSPGFKAVFDKSNVVVNNSYFGPGAGSIISTPDTVTTLNNCTFDGLGRIVSAVAPQGWFGGTLNINSPVIGAPNADVAFWMGNVPGIINVTDANLSGIASVLTARVTQGTLNFTSCTLFNDIDTLDDTGGPGVTGTGVNINFDRSIVACNIGAGASANSTAAVRVSGRNTQFNTFGRAQVVALNGNSTVADLLVTTHCTFIGLSGNVLIDVNPIDRVEGYYTIYDASDALSTSANGTNELFGRNNLVYPNGFIARPLDTITADPQLGSNGRPTAGSIATIIDRAYKSTATVDGDNQARPQGNNHDIGAYEGVGLKNDWATYPAAQASTAPVIDGTLSPDEWRTTAINFSAATLEALGGTSITQVVPSDGDLAGTMYIMWDANALYMAGRVTDDDIEYLADQGSPLNGTDVVQLATDHRFIRSDVTSTPGIYIHDIVPGQAANNALAAYWQHWPTQVGNPGNELGNYPDTFPNASFAGRTSGNVYEVELRLPWGDFLPNPPVPAVGLEMGYLALMADFDAGAFQTLYWNGGNGFNNIAIASGWNMLRLTNALITVNAAQQWNIYE